ncbi:MAG: tyrosine-protein kinase family protein [Deltaproteobacteria bacterium]|nr:MAG: tyrosine-protein kinase family protein [Deltaproteobacteria bacterium]
MQPSSPTEVLEAFGRCARALDEDGARALSIGWDEPGDAPRRLYKQAAQGRWELRALGPAQVSEKRAVQQLTLYWPERRRTVGAVWAHLVEEPEGWRVAGAQGDIRVAGLFLSGLTPPVLTSGDLPGSDEAEAWGEAWLAELHRDVLLSARDVKAAWDLPMLGHVPPFPSSEDHAPSLRGVEASHPALAAHARLRDALAEHPRIVLVSSVSGEGKSTFGANLAYARGLMGQRVVLADGDLHMPRVWRRWKVDPGPGLCECVEGLDPLAALQESSADGVSLFTAGRAPEDKLAVLRAAGPVFRAFQGFDSVIIDGAPGVQYDDAFVLAEVAEAAMVVIVEVGKTRRASLEALRARFEAHGVTPVGLILNRTPVDDAGELRELAADEQVEMRVLGSRWLEAANRGAVGLHFGRPGERGRTEWVILERQDGELVKVGLSKVLSLEAILRGADIVGPEAHGREWRAQELTRAFGTAVDRGVQQVVAKVGPQAQEPAAAFAQIIQALVQDAVKGGKPSTPSVPVTVDASGKQVGGPKPVKMPDSLRESVVGAVEKVLGEQAARGENLTPEMIQAHGPELAGEVLGAILGEALPTEVTAADGRALKLDLDLASIFGSFLNKGDA